LSVVGPDYFAEQWALAAHDEDQPPPVEEKTTELVRQPIGEFVEISNNENAVYDGTLKVQVVLPTASTVSLSINGQAPMLLNNGATLTAGAAFEASWSVRKGEKITVSTAAASFSYLRILNFPGI
jgi:hypothetical protein